MKSWRRSYIWCWEWILRRLLCFASLPTLSCCVWTIVSEYLPMELKLSIGLLWVILLIFCSSISVCLILQNRFFKIKLYYFTVANNTSFCVYGSVSFCPRSFRILMFLAYIWWVSNSFSSSSSWLSSFGLNLFDSFLKVLASSLASSSSSRSFLLLLSS